jgi:hypothetical protein
MVLEYNLDLLEFYSNSACDFNVNDGIILLTALRYKKKEFSIELARMGATVPLYKLLSNLHNSMILHYCVSMYENACHVTDETLRQLANEEVVEILQDRKGFDFVAKIFHGGTYREEFCKFLRKRKIHCKTPSEALRNTDRVYVQLEFEGLKDKEFFIPARETVQSFKLNISAIFGISANLFKLTDAVDGKVLDDKKKVGSYCVSSYCVFKANLVSRERVLELKS